MRFLAAQLISPDGSSGNIMGITTTAAKLGFNIPAGFGSQTERPQVPTELQTEKLPVKTNFTPEAERILSLLADGHSQETVATTLGITPSAVSQHVSQDDFREELARRKTQKLEKYKVLDNMYDEVELDLLQRLKSSVFMMTRPGEITAALSKINAMKRRLGAQDSGSSNPVQTVVNLTLPSIVVQNLVTTPQGHVVGIGNKSLVTIPSGALQKLAAPPAAPPNANA